MGHYQEHANNHMIARLQSQLAAKDQENAMLQKLLEIALSEVPMGAFANDKIKIFQKALDNKEVTK